MQEMSGTVLEANEAKRSAVETGKQAHEGWRKAEAEVTALKKQLTEVESQLEVATQLSQVLSQHSIL